MPETPNSPLPLVQRAPLATRRRFRLLRRLGALLLVSFLIWFGAMTWSAVRITQFRRASPGANEFLALKRRLDPTNKFRNELLDNHSYPG